MLPQQPPRVALGEQSNPGLLWQNARLNKNRVLCVHVNNDKHTYLITKHQQNSKYDSSTYHKNTSIATSVDAPQFYNSSGLYHHSTLLYAFFRTPSTQSFNTTNRYIHYTVLAHLGHYHSSFDFDKQLKQLNDTALLNKSPQSYGVLVAIWHHTVLPTTRHK